jgi:hypothetical protein
MILIFLLGASPVMLAQDGITQKQQEKILHKKAREDKKAKARKVKEDRKRHLAIQDKATRKRIKHNTKRADRKGSGSHKERGLRKLFSRKR